MVAPKSNSTGSAVIQPRRRAKRRTLCRVARALAVAFGERPEGAEFADQIGDVLDPE
jgi:hypothetical protein